jgi:hypothetical protein
MCDADSATIDRRFTREKKSKETSIGNSLPKFQKILDSQIVENDAQYF